MCCELFYFRTKIIQAVFIDILHIKFKYDYDQIYRDKRVYALCFHCLLEDFLDRKAVVNYKLTFLKAV